jgi:hypothetical protein
LCPIAFLRQTIYIIKYNGKETIVVNRKKKHMGWRKGDARPEERLLGEAGKEEMQG